jgi:hypothetical protein
MRWYFETGVVFNLAVTFILEGQVDGYVWIPKVSRCIACLKLNANGERF